MYAIVEIAGLQYKVEKDQQLYVNRLKGEEGDSITFDRVLLTDNGNVTIGAPAIDGLTVGAKILEHVKGDKVIVFKKKRRKGYKKKNGFRASLTKIEITAIGDDTSSNSKKEDKTKKEAPKKAETKETAQTEDKLTVVEGIGPKTQSIFNENGILTYSDLAAKSADELKEILTPHGGRYAAMDTTTWPKQAQLAAEGKFDELQEWQKELNGGKK